MTATLHIRDVSARSGFSSATLRYYEQIGLLTPSGRTAAGYRLYDDAVIERLAFIGRAKRLGCSLDEIAELVKAWEGGECGPIQDRLRTLVTDQLGATRHQIIELIGFTEQLERAAATLERHRPDGPCDERCGCVGESGSTGEAWSEPVTLSTKFGVTKSAVPIACTLEAAAMPRQVDDWQSMIAHSTARETIDGGVRVTFEPGTSVAQLAELVAAEQQCCTFFDFAITVDRRGLALEARAPADALPIVYALLGTPIVGSSK